MPHVDDTPDRTPAEEQVRRMLADARHTGPMPDDVADRLDGVLSDLRRGGVTAAASTSPTDLAAARRRRRLRTLLVAAAAVLVVGVGIDRIDFSGMSSDVDSAADGSAESATTADAGSEGPAQVGPEGADLWTSPVRISSGRFGHDVRRARAVPRTATLDGGAAASRPEEDQDGAFTYGAGRGCATDGWGSGRLVPVRYDGMLGALVFRRAEGDTEVVDLFLCGSEDPTRSITLPAP